MAYTIPYYTILTIPSWGKSDVGVAILVEQVPVLDISCGFGWANSCEIQVQHAIGGYALDVNELDIEIAARPLKLQRL